MRLMINGAKAELEEGITVGQLLKKLSPSGARVAILVNDSVVKNERKDSQALKDGDHVEFLTFAGGG
jgi:thiamine biosynthesis protein ThiS